jgi:hypothetical protein
VMRQAARARDVVALYLNRIFRTFGADNCSSLLLSIICTILAIKPFGFSRRASKFLTGIG